MDYYELIHHDGSSSKGTPQSGGPPLVVSMALLDFLDLGDLRHLQGAVANQIAHVLRIQAHLPPPEPVPATLPMGKAVSLAQAEVVMVAAHEVGWRPDASGHGVLDKAG